MSRPRRILRRIGKASLYLLFFLVATFLFTYWTLPFEQIRDRYLKVAQDKLGMEIVGKIEKHWFTGIRARKLTLIPRRKPGTPKKTKLPEQEIEEAVVRLAVLPLFLGRISLGFSAKLAGGELEGSFTRRSGGNQIEAKLEKIDLKGLALLELFLKKSLTGVLSGDVNVILGRNPASSRGKATLEVAGLKLGTFKVPIAKWGNQPITVPAMNLGNLKAVLEMDDGAAVFKEFHIQGSPDIEASAKGYLIVSQPLARSTVRAYVKFRFSDSFFKRNPKFRILQGTLTPAKRRDGYYGYLISGPLGIPALLRQIPMPREPGNLKPPTAGARPPPRRVPPGRRRGAPLPRNRTRLPGR